MDQKKKKLERPRFPYETNVRQFNPTLPLQQQQLTPRLSGKAKIALLPRQIIRKKGVRSCRRCTYISYIRTYRDTPYSLELQIIWRNTEEEHGPTTRKVETHQNARLATEWRGQALPIYHTGWRPRVCDHAWCISCHKLYGTACIYRRNHSNKKK